MSPPSPSLLLTVTLSKERVAVQHAPSERPVPTGQVTQPDGDRYPCRAMETALLIMVREGFEAALVVAIVFAYLRRLERIDLAVPVWAGVAAAAVVSVLVGVVVNQTIGELEGPRAGSRAFAAISFLAAAVLTWMIFWMRRQSRLIKGELEQQGRRRARGRATSGFALAGVAFVAVLREGIEAALFLIAAADQRARVATSVVGRLIGLAIAVRAGLPRLPRAGVASRPAGASSRSPGWCSSSSPPGCCRKVVLLPPGRGRPRLVQPQRRLRRAVAACGSPPQSEVGQVPRRDVRLGPASVDRAGRDLVRVRDPGDGRLLLAGPTDDRRRVRPTRPAPTAPCPSDAALPADGFGRTTGRSWSNN